MATIKQKRAVQKIVENGGNATNAMREAGYSEASVNNPSNLTKSKGYREILNETGLNEQVVVKALVSDIRNKAKNRVRELSLAADILGMRKNIEEILKPQIKLNIINFKDFSDKDRNHYDEVDRRMAELDGRKIK
ncbi:MAG: hypothetical protein JWO50_757 [Candidatus Kaiserbacteria bacterium]|nr:hypothetical protein [Candidatus Kaiserbacteria bacterium]